MTEQEATKILIQALEQLQTLCNAYKCDLGTMKIGNYARALFGMGDVLEAIKLLRS